MARIKVVREFHECRLAAMACVLGFAGGLVCLRLPVGGETALDVPLVFFLGTLPSGLLLPYFDQRLRKQPRYTAAAGGGAIFALVLQSGGGLLEFVAEGVFYTVCLWLVGLAGAALGFLASRACYRLVIQDGKTCPGCGYCLVGLGVQVCPECGRAFTYDELGTTRERLQALAQEA